MAERVKSAIKTAVGLDEVLWSPVVHNELIPLTGLSASTCVCVVGGLKLSSCLPVQGVSGV